VAVNRVNVIWTGTPVVGGGLTVFNFDSATGTPAQQVAAVAAFLGATEDQRAASLSWTTAPDVQSLNVGTGVLEGSTATTPASGVGTAVGDALPPVVQGLLRIVTSQVVGGRILRGRIFLPGPTEAKNSASGAPDSIIQTDYNTAGAALISDANTAWTVWSRTHGVNASVSTANMWNKWAELRSRRD
jgi:hypothetical protein